MPKTISLCSDKSGCKWNFANGCDNNMGRDRGDAVYYKHVLIGCSAYEEKPLDKVGEFMVWYRNGLIRYQMLEDGFVEAKLREIFGGKE